jgi:DNA-binding NarL/FixJ family response regulator
VVETCGPGGPRGGVGAPVGLDEVGDGAVAAGGPGVRRKNSGPDLLVEAIRSAAVDESLISPAVATRLLSHIGRSTTRALGKLDHLGLSEREEQVLRAVALGSTNTEIAAELHLSVSTVKAHVANLLAKVEARNRVELAMWAYRTGRVD